MKGVEGRRENVPGGRLDRYAGGQTAVREVRHPWLRINLRYSCRRKIGPLIGLTGNKIREDVIVRNWPDILRVAATLASGVPLPSQLLRRFAAYLRQHELTVALREIGRVERTLFIVDWLLDADMQLRSNTGLNKGEAHHAFKNALRIGCQGEIRDRSSATAWPGSTCSPPSSFTGIPPISAKRSDSGNTPV